jgi:hypothetical protein
MRTRVWVPTAVSFCSSKNWSRPSNLDGRRRLNGPPVQSGSHTGVEASLPYRVMWGTLVLCEFSLWTRRYVGLEPKLNVKRVAGHVQILVWFCFSFSRNFDYGMRARGTKSSHGLSFALGLLTNIGSTSENVHEKWSGLDLLLFSVQLKFYPVHDLWAAQYGMCYLGWNYKFYQAFICTVFLKDYLFLKDFSMICLIM